MRTEERMDIVRQVQSGTLEPLAAAELYAANGEEFEFGVDLKAAGPEAAARLEVFMGRLLWLTLHRAGVPLPEPQSLEDYRQLLAQGAGEDDDPA